ncbi:MAG: PTS sugar transporter subunit IIA [Pirellulaceae bacterium]|nr:PTS sugar transporter subunit IIA [Pirellulaceae bacterium]
MPRDEDFTVDSLASYLHLLPAQIAKLADRGELPARKVSGQWRFSPAEIHHWMEQRMGVLDDDGLAHVEGVLERAATDSVEPINITKMLPVESIAVPLAARTRGRVIQAMSQLAATSGFLWDADKMADAVRAREDMQPTALDNGVALLHPRRPIPSILGESFLAFGRTATGIPFGNSRGMLTDIFLLICSTDDRGHLRTLARISRLFTDNDFLAALRMVENAQAVHTLIANKEADLK